jgi:hypothetical protein
VTQKYELTDEHRAQLKPWADQWIANAMRCTPMTDAEREQAREAARGLYRAAGLEPPPDHRIVFVPSPFVLRFAGGFAAAIWHERKNGKVAATHAATDDATSAATYAATHAATDDATSAATRAATHDATYAATYAATHAATYAATHDATHAATYAATHAATYAATRDATDDATDDATSAATRDAKKGIEKNDRWYSVSPQKMAALAKALGVGLLGLKCAQEAWRMWQGGNQWSYWDSFLTFFRHVAKLPLDYSKYDHWETLSKTSGPRIMHPEFCMISDFPTHLQVDEQSRPHCETGPFSAWADGSGLYALHGVRVPAWSVETPKDEIEPKDVLALENTEQRAAIMRHVGLHRFLGALGAEQIDQDGDYRLYYLNVGSRKIGPYLFMRCPSTSREFLEGVGDADKYDDIDPTIKTCADALKWRQDRACGGLGLSPIGCQGDVIFFDFEKRRKAQTLQFHT